MRPYASILAAIAVVGVACDERAERNTAGTKSDAAAPVSETATKARAQTDETRAPLEVRSTVAKKNTAPSPPEAARARDGGRCAGTSDGAAVKVIEMRHNAWNRVFDRTTGWWHSDGGMTAKLPGDRNIWLFGDTWFRDNDRIVFNSMAVQKGTGHSPPKDGDIRFFARDDAGKVLDITQDGSGARRAWLDSPLSDAWLWPAEPIVVDGTLFAVFTELICIKGAFPKCRGFVDNIRIRGHRVVTIANPGARPETWDVKLSPLVDARGASPRKRQLFWGSSLLEQGGWVYVFGVGFEPGWTPMDIIKTDIRTDAKVARAKAGSLKDYSRWQFLTSAGWKEIPNGPDADDLVTVAADVPTEYSVDRVSWNGETRHLLVHAVIPTSEIVIRVSRSGAPESFAWDGPTATRHTWRGSIGYLDPMGVGAMTWAGRAHPQLSKLPDDLLVSYYSGQLNRLRFLRLPLDRWRPWCAQADGGAARCWH